MAGSLSPDVGARRSDPTWNWNVESEKSTSYWPWLAHLTSNTRTAQPSASLRAREPSTMYSALPERRDSPVATVMPESSLVTGAAGEVLREFGRHVEVGSMGGTRTWWTSLRPLVDA